MQKKIFTIGYEGVTTGRLIETLQGAGVKMLIDVRAVPLSRKPGFSKNKLAAALQEEGIGYLGLKGLGTPAEGRAAARRGDKAGLERIFGAHLQTVEAQRDMEEALRVAGSVPACLLCYEHAPDCCHRLIVAERMAARSGQSIVHLAPVK